MFGFLKRLFRRRKSVEKLRSAWAANRTPAVAEDLARALLDRGEIDEALRLLKEAYRLFPRAERIRSYYHHTLRRKSSQEIRSLRRAIATNGRAEIYARLAELYRYLGHFEEAIEVAREGIEKYPEFSGNHLAIGRIHYTRFLKTSSARDGRQAAGRNVLGESHLGLRRLGVVPHPVRVPDQLVRVRPGRVQVPRLRPRGPAPVAHDLAGGDLDGAAAVAPGSLAGRGAVGGQNAYPRAMHAQSPDSDASLLAQRTLELVRIPSSTGEEAALADHVEDFLRRRTSPSLLRRR